jgi:hypothetical protein
MSNRAAWKSGITGAAEESGTSGNTGAAEASVTSGNNRGSRGIRDIRE